MNEVATLTDLFRRHQPVTAMLAPSFPIVYQYPQIIGKLKRLGFAHVVEVAAGAKDTNTAVIAALQQNPKSRFITSPCPSFVRMIRTKHPEVMPYLALSVDSPMVATARIVKREYPGEQPIFIGPCNAKRFEASEDHPELNMLALTYIEMQAVFEALGVSDEEGDQTAQFDIAYAPTRLYPISGGLAQSSGVRAILSDDEIEVVSGWKNDDAAIGRFMSNPRLRLLDILFCEGGCIQGPGIVSPLDVVARRDKISRYWEQTST